MSTVLELANQVCDLIPIKRVTAVFGSANKTGKMLATLLKSELANIHEAYDWRSNQITQLVSSPVPFTEILLPVKFDNMLPDAVWDTGTGYRVVPLNDTDFLSVINDKFKGVNTLGNYYRVLKKNGIYTIQFAYEYPVGTFIQVTYKSNVTVLDINSNELESPTTDTDTPIYPDHLVRAALHKAMLLNIGMDAKYPIAEYGRLLNLAISKDTDSGVVSMHRGSRTSFLNIPETGYGV